MIEGEKQWLLSKCAYIRYDENSRADDKQDWSDS